MTNSNWHTKLQEYANYLIIAIDYSQLHMKSHRIGCSLSEEVLQRCK